MLGGGLVAGAVVLLAGEPGVGKSTLLLDVASRAAQQGRTVLYVTGEESAGQVRLRAERIGALRPRLLIAAETDLGTVLGHVEQASPDLLVVDSVQTVASDAVDGTAGNVTQVREVAASLIRVAKERGMATVLVGHVTKDGSIAGPRVLEHLVDVVCQFEGDRHSRLRMVRAVKNRYGPDRRGRLLRPVRRRHRRPARPERPVPVAPRRAGAGHVRHRDAGGPPAAGERGPGAWSRRRRAARRGARRPASTAAASRWCWPCSSGGPRSGWRAPTSTSPPSAACGSPEPACDLAIALAVVSAVTDQPLAPGTVALGEVGLAGEVRRVGRRLAAADRGRAARVHAGRRPERSDDPVPAPDGMVVHEVDDLHGALTRAACVSE